MLNFIYYPISWVLWFWHKIFGFIIGWLPGYDGPASGLAWVLSIVFLVVTIRVLLYIPMVKQVRSMRAMQEIQPQMKALQKKYKKDRQRLGIEMQKLNKEHGVNPLMGCLPMLVQIPVFMGLFQVLRSFNKMGTGYGQLGFSAERTRESSNYFFGSDEVRSFLDARFLGSPMSGSMLLPRSEYDAFVPIGHPIDFSLANIAVVAIPLMIISAVTLHINARLSLSRQTPEAAAQPQAAVMNKLALWVFPFFILATGSYWSIGLLVYMVTNNLWTFFQQRHVYNKMDEEEKARTEKREESRASLAPKPGAKPVREPKVQESQTTTVTKTDGLKNDSQAVSSNPKKKDATDAGTKPSQKNPPGKSNPTEVQRNRDKQQKSRKRRKRGRR